MPSSFFGLTIASSGMGAYSAALNTTAHNIANINTTGYSKQTALQQAKNAISLKTHYGMLGAGTIVTEIVSSRDEYYDNKYRISNAVYGRYSTLSYYMQNLEDYLYVVDEETGGLTNSLDNFLPLLLRFPAMLLMQRYVPRLRDMQILWLLLSMNWATICRRCRMRLIQRLKMQWTESIPMRSRLRL